MRLHLLQQKEKQNFNWGRFCGSHDRDSPLPHSSLVCWHLKKQTRLQNTANRRWRLPIVILQLMIIFHHRPCTQKDWNVCNRHFGTPSPMKCFFPMNLTERRGLQCQNEQMDIGLTTLQIGSHTLKPHRAVCSAPSFSHFIAVLDVEKTTRVHLEGNHQNCTQTTSATQRQHQGADCWERRRHQHVAQWTDMFHYIIMVL